MPTQSPGVAILLATDVAQGAPGELAQAWLADGFRRWLDSDRAMSLERFLGLPGTPAKARRALRDFWLCDAAAQLGDDLAVHQRSSRLLAALVRISCGLPTDEHPDLEASLRRAAESDHEMPSTVPGITRIIG